MGKNFLNMLIVTYLIEAVVDSVYDRTVLR